MKNVLIVSDVYPPEISSAASLMQELAEEVKKRGNKVWIATSFPKHYLPQYFQKGKIKEFTEEKGINVIRVKTFPLHKVNFIVRGVAQLILPPSLFSKIKSYINEKIDTVIVYSPPLTLALLGAKIKKKYGAKFVLNIQDIFPQNAIDIGVLKKWKHWPAIRLFEIIEKKAYKNADKITFHSEGGKRFLVEKKKVPENKITAVYNWINPKPFRELTKRISFRKKWGLENKFIFLFAGIMGPAQGIDLIIKIAKKVSDTKDIVFLLVGDGTEKEKLEELIKKLGLKNVLIKEFIPKEIYPYLVREIDVGLICLSPQNKTPFIPGKFLGYMMSAKPVLAFLNKESDGFSIVERAKCGYAVESNNFEKAVEIIQKIYGERGRLKMLGENGFDFASKHFTLDQGIKGMGLD